MTQVAHKHCLFKVLTNGASFLAKFCATVAEVESSYFCNVAGNKLHHATLPKCLVACNIASRV